MRNAAINLRALSEQRDLIGDGARLPRNHRSDFALEAPRVQAGLWRSPRADILGHLHRTFRPVKRRYR